MTSTLLVRAEHYNIVGLLIEDFVLKPGVPKHAPMATRIAVNVPRSQHGYVCVSAIREKRL